MQIETSSSAEAVTAAVTGAGGGAGASTLLAALGTRAAAAGRRVVAVDLDPCGGGLDVALGLEAEPGLRWPDLMGADGEMDGARLLAELPGRGELLVVLSHGRVPQEPSADLVRRCLRALGSHADLVLLDVATGAIPPEGQTQVVLVGRGTVRGVAAAGAITRRLAGAGAPVQLVLRDAPPRTAGDVAEALGVSLAADLHSDRTLDADTDRGLAPGRRARSSLAQVCDRLLANLLADRPWRAESRPAALDPRPAAYALGEPA
ncbi:hypothetical protein [Leekyejoonella antrihumi]|uniref:Pilus assembly protein FlpE n=1 Tax=Leekyejoonella antrihumi TaxID=1660198 RepID=A0A563DWL1_9MICO|nr:hypothetical protein [Leekyejoonella antrihumi]TWP34313.1 hypothetical protein FGL98_17935 [Leekyejoonella antrihumi]